MGHIFVNLCYRFMMLIRLCHRHLHSGDRFPTVMLRLKHVVRWVKGG